MATTNGKSKGSANRSSNKRSRTKVDSKSTWPVKKWAIRVFSCVALGVALILIRFFFKEPPVIRVSPIIRQHITLAKSMMENEVQMRIFLADDPLFEVMKDGLRPIQDRLASLRTQTSQYERMERIPGGPKSFISSSLQELEVHSKELTKLSIQALEQIKKYGIQQKMLSRGSLELMEHGKKLQNDVNIKMMILHNLKFFGPTKHSPEVEQELEKLASQITLNEVLVVLTHLSSEYEKMEELAMRATGIAKEIGVESLQLLKDAEMTDDEYDRILPAIQQLEAQRQIVEREKTKYENYLHLFYILKHRVMESLMKMSEQLLNYESERRFTYFKLHDMILSDIKQLKVRVQNLQYKYLKRSVDL